MPFPILDSARSPRNPHPAPPPPPAWYDIDLEGTGASVADAAMNSPGRYNEMRSGRLASAAADLSKLLGRPSGYYNFPQIDPTGVPQIDETTLWRDLAELRRRQPDALKNYGRDRGDFDARLRDELRVNREDREADMARNGAAANFAGSMVGGLADPINMLAMAAGGPGGSALRQIVMNGVINAGTEAAETPLLQAERHAQGREQMTGGEIATNVAAAFAGGAGLDAAVKGAVRLPSASRTAFERTVAANWDRLPQGLRDRWAARATIDGTPADDALVSDIAEALIGRGRMSEAEGDALDLLRRNAEIEQASPFLPDGAGNARHKAALEAAFDRVLSSPQPSSAARIRASTAVRQQDAALAPATSLDRAYGAILGIEGGANRDGSFRTSPAGAIGPAQLMPGTAPQAMRLAGYSPNDPRWRTDPAVNVAAGRAYYEEMLRQFDGDPVKAAAAYNAGPGSARRGTGVRGAMARAERAGRPGDWADFLPSETRAYVENFRRRTGAAGGEVVHAGEPAARAGLDAEAGRIAEQRRALIDDMAERAAQAEAPELPGMFPPREMAIEESPLPMLRRDLFPDDTSWRVAQSAADAAALDVDPVITRQSVWAEARDDLMAARSGEADAALFHPDVGPIDVRWGNDQGGLAHIAAKHPEVLENLPALIDSMGVKSRSANRVTLQSLDHRAVVRLDYDGQAKKWLLSAYQVKGKAPPPAEYRGAGEAARDHSPAREAAPIIGAPDAPGKVAVNEAAPEALAAFDDPAGEGAAMTAASDWHDIEQLLDAGKLEGARIDLDDGRGERSLAEFMEELKEDEAAAAALRGCL